MPSVSADLHGRAWFSAAFSATLAASVVGMVAGGLWSDRSGPRLPLLASVAVFAGGLLLAGLAPGIELFVAARFLQGLGAGAMTVALYVVVARIYAPIDHPRIFGAFAAAWVIPSMVGPSVAGVVLEAFGWRWVFLGVVALGGRGDRHAAAGAARARRQPGAVVGGDSRPARAERSSSPVPWSHSTWPAAPPPRSASWRPSSRWWSCWSPYARCCRPAPSSYAAGCRRWSRCAAPSRRRSSRPRSTCPTCSRSTTTCRRGCPGRP